MMKCARAGSLSALYHLMMVREGMGFVVMSGELPKVAVDVVRVAALGFQLNGHVFDAEA